MLGKDIRDRVYHSELFKRAWFFPVMTVLVFTFVVSAVFVPWGAEAAPAWVQAVGSIAAILAAWLIPHYHELSRVERTRNNIYDSAGWLAIRISSGLSSIESVLERAGCEENEARAVRAWREFGALASSEIHRKAADELPIEMFTGYDISYLLAIRSAAAFGEECARLVHNWDFEHSPLISVEFPMYEQLSHHRRKIGWALDHTYGRPESKLPRVKL